MRMRHVVWLAALALACWGLASCRGKVGSYPNDPAAPSATGSSGTGGPPASGAAGTGAADPVLPPPVLFEAVGPESYTAKVKNLLTGLPPTSAEIAAVTADPKALRGLIDQWMALPQFQTKMLVFFRNAFQQAQVDNTTLLDQMGGRGIPSNGPTLQRLIVNVQEMFARTAWQLVATNKPFNGAIDTHTYMVTTALASFLALLDDRYVDDAGRTQSRWVKANPMLTVTATSDLTIPMTDSMDPASPNYLKISTGMEMPTCANPARSFTGQDAPVQLFSLLMGRVDSDKTITDGMTCKAFNMTPILTDADFSDWHPVTVRAPKVAAGEAITKFYDVAALRTAKELVLNVPRVGFMTTPAFFANWSTNTSNLYRVTMNQTLIVSLGASFDGSGNTIPVSETGLDMEHASPGSPCYGCHQTLDPMRQLFAQSFTLFYHEQTDATKIAQSGVFTFEGVSHVANGAGELATALATHPRVASAWTQKLCFYADSAACTQDDPEFERVADVFKTSNFNWKTLVRELFSSPLVTGTARTKTFDDRGVPVSVARRDHLCSALEQRLGISDPCGISGLPGLTGAQNAVAVLVRGLPSDGYTRGAEVPILPTDSSLFFRSGTENICRRIADQMVDVAAAPTAMPPRLASRYQSTTPDAAITDLVATLMGLPDSDPRAAQAKQILTEHYQEALKVTGIKPREALKSTFVLACTAPSTISVGL